MADNSGYAFIAFGAGDVNAVVAAHAERTSATGMTSDDAAAAWLEHPDGTYAEAQTNGQYGVPQFTNIRAGANIAGSRTLGLPGTQGELNLSDGKQLICDYGQSPRYWEPGTGAACQHGLAATEVLTFRGTGKLYYSEAGDSDKNHVFFQAAEINGPSLGGKWATMPAFSNKAGDYFSSVELPADAVQYRTVALDMSDEHCFIALDYTFVPSAS